MKQKMVDCPRCGGYGFDDFDEAGRPYACYFCGTSGLVLASVAAEQARDMAWAYYVSAEKAIAKRVALGVPSGWAYRIDPEDGSVMLIPPRGERVPAPAGELEDIPF